MIYQNKKLGVSESSILKHFTIFWYHLDTQYIFHTMIQIHVQFIESKGRYMDL